MHGSRRIARGSSSRAADKLRALKERTLRARRFGAIGAMLVCSAAAAQPASYPGGVSPLALPPSLQASTPTASAVNVSPNLAQPPVVQPVSAPGQSNSSANIPGILQPQFLVTDQAPPAATPRASAATDSQPNEGMQRTQSDSTNARANQTIAPSPWSSLWRQATGGDLNNRTATSAQKPTATSNAQNNQSVWNELILPSQRQPSAASAKQSQSPNTYNPLASQLGFSDHAATTAEPDSNSPAAPSTAENKPRAAKLSAVPHTTATQASATATDPGFPGLWNQISGTNGRSADDANDRGGVKQAASWSEESNNQAQSRDQSEAAPPKAGFWSSLSRPLTAQTNEAPVRRPAPNPTADDTAESSQPPALLMPFYHTNTVPPADRGAAQIARARERNHGQDIANAVRASKLLAQLKSTTDENLRSQPGAIADSPLRTTHEAWDGGWTLRMPSELNPFKQPTTVPEPPVGLGSQAMTVAYLQDESPTPAEAIPEPEKIILPNGDTSASGDQPEKPETSLKANKNDEGGDNGDGKKKDKLATADKLGEKPVDNSLEFLRAETVLLKPGKYQFDIGFQYQIQERDFPVLFLARDSAPVVSGTHFAATDGSTNQFVVDQAHFKQREVEVPMQLRYGLFDKVQVFLGAPVGWANTEADLTNLDEFKNDGGLGDVYWGATIQFAAAEADCPYVIGTFVATAPSGGDPFTSAAAFSPNGPSLGNGFWRLAGNMLFIQPLDPVTFFYGAGIRGSFEHEYLGVNFEPGLEYNYTFGLGFAINEKVTLSAQLFGEYQSRLEANGQGIQGSTQEPISLQLAATIARPCDRFIEPFIQFGLTEDAVAANFGITWTY
jgi:hypothetical protein